MTRKTVVLFGTLFLLLTVFQTSARQGAVEGLRMCFNALVPSLLPFMLLCNAIVQLSGNISTPPIAKIARHFRLSSNEMTGFLLSLIGGYPSGAAALANTASADNDKRKADLAAYFVHPGPGFCIGTVGGVLYGSPLLGVILYLCEIAAAFLILFLSRHTRRSANESESRVLCPPLSAVFQAACAKTGLQLLSVCTVVTFFSAILGSLRQITPSQLHPIYAFFEVSAGVQSSKNLYFNALLLGFGGLCVMAQVQSFFKAKICFWRYLLIRLSAGALTALLLKGVLWLFPVRYRVAALRYIPAFSPVQNTVALTVLVVFFLLSISLEKNGGNLREDMLY